MVAPLYMFIKITELLKKKKLETPWRTMCESLTIWDKLVSEMRLRQSSHGVAKGCWGRSEECWRELCQDSPLFSGHFGLWLDGDLYRGGSHPCATFNNEVAGPAGAVLHQRAGGLGPELMPRRAASWANRCSDPPLDADEAALTQGSPFHPKHRWRSVRCGLWLSAASWRLRTKTAVETGHILLERGWSKRQLYLTWARQNSSGKWSF